MNDTTDTPTPVKLKFKSKLICASKCKKFAKEYAKINRPFNKFTRVSDDFLIGCENALRNHIESRIKSQPSKGKTLN